MQAGKRQHKNASSQAAAAAGRRAGVRQDSANQPLLSSKLTPKLNLQPKLSIGQPGDRHEQEADRVAEQVVSQPLQRTPSLEPPAAAKSQPQRPPAVTPVIQPQADEAASEESQFQEEEQVIQGKSLQFQEDSVADGEEIQAKVQLRTDTGGVSRGPIPSATARQSRLPKRPASRAPPLFSVQRGGMTARAPPIQLKCTAVQPKNNQPVSTHGQHQADAQGNSNFAPFQETGEVRPNFLQCRGPPIQTRTEASESRLDRELRQSRGGGMPLPEKSRIQMEASIGADFKNVRVHTDTNAARMNKMLGSQAFATGNAIFFGAGKYDPESRDGQRLLAHELTHTVQQNASPRRQSNPAVSPRAPPVQQSAFDLQGGFIGDRLNEYARHVPGWELFTVIIEYNPLTEQDVPRTPQNLLRGFMGLVPGGTALYDKLNENGLIDEAFSWLGSQLSDLDLSWSRLRNAIDAAWEEMDFIRWDPFDYNLRVLKRHLLPIWNDVKEFANRVIDKTVELVRTTLLTPLVNFIKERTRAYPLLTVILGEDPVTGEPVDRSLYNIVAAFLMLTESGEEYLNKLNESGKLQELSDWLDAEIERLDVSVETVTNAFSEAWELLDLNAVLHPIDTFTRLYNIFAGPVTRLFNFVVAVAMKVLGLIKDWLLGLLKEYANDIPGYPLLRVILGKDPLTGEAVPRTAENFIRGFMSFVPGGVEKFNNLKESGAIDKAFAWLEKAIKKLGLIGAAFANAFSQIWESFSINDLTDPIGAFERVVAIFTEPVRMLIEFAIEVGLKVLEFIFEGVLGPTGARVLAIMKKARSTFLKIIKDPIKFVKNLIDAVKKGFGKFSSNILKHLKAGLIGWLVGTLGSAGIKLPEKWDLKGIVTLVLEILGLTYDRIRPKLVKVLGEKTVSILETTFEVVKLLVTEGPGALWQKFLEYIDNLKETVIGGIRDWVITKVVTSAVTKIATMLNPAGAVIQAIIAIYNTVMFFIERINQILDLVESVVNSISKIAAGKLDDAANFVEQSMARTIPVIISFLARLLGLGNIAGTIQKIIKKIQGAVDKALDKVIAWVVAAGRKLMNWLRGRGGEQGAASGIRVSKTANVGDDRVTIVASKEGSNVEVKVGTQDINTWLQQQNVDESNSNATAQMTQARSKAGSIRALLGNENVEHDRVESQLTQLVGHIEAFGVAGTPEERLEQARTEITELTRSEDDTADLAGHFERLKTKYGLAKIEYRSLGSSASTVFISINPDLEIDVDNMEMRLQGTGATDIATNVDVKTSVNWHGGRLSFGSRSFIVGSQMLAHPILSDHGAGEEALRNASQTPMMDMLPGKGYVRGDYNGSTDKYIKGHLLNDNLGGPAQDMNLFPITDSANKAHLNWVEKHVKKDVVAGFVGSYSVEVNPGPVTPRRHPKNSSLRHYTVNATFQCRFKRLNAALQPVSGTDVTINIASTFGMSENEPTADLQQGDQFRRAGIIGPSGAPVPVGDSARVSTPPGRYTGQGRDIHKGDVDDPSRSAQSSGIGGPQHTVYDPTATHDRSRSAIKAAAISFIQNQGGGYVSKSSVSAHMRSLYGLSFSSSELSQIWGDREFQSGRRGTVRVRTKLEVGQPSDRYEQEADRVADNVVGTEATTVQTMPSISTLQRYSEADTPGLVQEPFKSGGEPLPEGTRTEMKSGIGADFSDVKVHTDSNAIQMSKDMGAMAFTHQNHVYFNEGRYAPESSEGKHLLAHELTHVVQQDSRIRRQPLEPAATAPPAAAEKETKGPLVLGGAIMPGLESPVEGEIRSPAQVEEQAEAEAGIKKDKQAPGAAAKGAAKGGKAKPEPAGAGKKEAVAPKKGAVEKPAAKQRPAPAPKPIKGGSSDGMLNDFMTSAASRIAASYPSLGAGVSETLKAEKKQAADSAPKLTAKAGKGPMSARAPPVEEKRAGQAAIEEKQSQPDTPQKVPEHKDLAQPLNNTRNNKALDQSPAGSWISWFKDRVVSFMSGIRTKDEGVNTRAGKPPKAELTGEADPKRSATQRRDGDNQTAAEKNKVSATIKANPGKERIQPAPVQQTNNVRIEAAAARIETAKQDDMGDYVQMPLPENVRKKADQDMAPLLEKSLAKPKDEVRKAADKRNSDKQAEVSKAKDEVNKLNHKADQDQKNIVGTSRSDVASQQKQGLDEADQQIKKYRKEADKEQTSLRDSVKKRVKEDEGKAAAKLKKAEQDAEKEKKKKEAEAAAKKRELKRKQKKKSWWDRVVDAVKSVVKAITKAIDGIFNALRKAVKFIIDTAKKAALAVIELGRKFVVGLLNTFRKFLKSLVSNLIGKIFPELARKINKAIDKVVDKAIAGVNKVADALKKGVEALANALGKLLDKILSVFQTALKAAVQIAGAVLTGDFAEAAKIAFYAACDILGINPKSVINFMEKAGESLGKIFKSPGTFFNNVARGVRKGIDQFVAKIKQHLLNGLIAWLTGAMGDVQITLPKKFDIKGIFSLVTQILGLTYDNIRAKVVKKLGPKGEKIVSTLEKTFALVKDLVTKGPIALWERVQQSLSNLKDKVIEGIRNAVIEKVVKAGVVWLISMLNPASALVKAIKMLYDLVMFFVERWDQIVAFAKSIWNSVNALANGRIGAAANAVEQALARSIPVILSLLASLLGLGGIGKSVQKVIGKIRKPIDATVEKVIDFIFKQAKKLMNKLTGKADKPRDKQTPQEREKNKKACEKEIRAIMTRGTTLGKFKAMMPKLKKKYQVREIRMDADFDVKVINSDPAEIKVAVAHEIGLDKEGKLVEAKSVSTGKRGEPKYDKPKPKEEFTFGTINSSSDHPPSLKAVLEKELQKHQLSLEEIEYNKYFSGFPAAPARPSRVSGTIYGYIAGKIGAKARTGTSAVVGKMGNREASFREGRFKGGEGGYDGGHLISHSFGGPDAYYNLVPMKARVNRQVYGGIEKFMRNQVRIDPSVLPLDKKKSNLDISVVMSYGSGSYNINMGQFLKVAAGGLKSEKDKLRKQQEENLAKKLKLEEIKKGLPKDPKKAEAELKRYRTQRDAKKSELKKLRKTEERDLLIWNLTQGSGVKGASAILRDKKQARTQVEQAKKILDPLSKLIAGLKKADPSTVLIGFLETRHRVITQLIADYGKDYADKPRHRGDRRLSMQGLLLRAHVHGLQKPRDLTRNLERELTRTPTIPDSEKEIDAKIQEYDARIQHAIKELVRTDQAVKLKTLEDKSISDAGSAPVHSRIPPSFTVDLEYEAIAGKGGKPMVKGDSKGTRKAFSKADFQTPPGASTASYGTITVSNATPATPLIIEKRI